MRPIKRMVAIVAALATFPLVSSTAARAGDLRDLAWLAGCWQQRGEDRLVEEQWTAPRGGTMVGLSRTVAAGKTTAYEFMLVEQIGDKLRFTARPSGQQGASFAEEAADATSVTFVNAAHDFPQRVRYRRLPDGTAVGQIEGTVKGERRVVDFPLVRVPCPPG